MRTALLATAALAGAALVPTASAAPPCKNLLVDPAGDADFLNAGGPGSRVEDGRAVDLLSGDLASDRKALTVVIRTRGANPEGGTDYLDHSWHLSFSTSTERFIAAAESTRTGGAHYRLYRVVAGDDVPEDGEGPGASAAEGVDTTVTGSLDEVRGLIRMSIPLSAFAEWKGLGKQLTRVRAIAWSGAGAHDPGGNGVATYGSSDFGSTRASYTVGARGCV